MFRTSWDSVWDTESDNGYECFAAEEQRVWFPEYLLMQAGFTFHLQPNVCALNDNQWLKELKWKGQTIVLITLWWLYTLNLLLPDWAAVFPHCNQCLLDHLGPNCSTKVCCGCRSLFQPSSGTPELTGSINWSQFISQSISVFSFCPFKKNTYFLKPELIENL